MLLNKNKLQSIIYISIFLIFIPLTYLYPRANDEDYGYAFYDKNIKTIGDFFESTFALYMTKTGRIWNNGLAAILGTNDWDIVFKSINALFFVLFIFFMVKVAIKDENITLSKIFLLFILIWFLCPVPGETWLWMCGALNYLWPAAITMGFLYMLRLSTYRKFKLLGGVFIVSIFYGWQHEIFAAPICAACIMYYLIKRPNLPKQTFLLCAGYFIGAICMIFAPGGFHRSGGSIFSTESIAMAILFRIYSLGMLFIGLKLKATIIAIVILSYIKFKSPASFKELVSNNLLIILIIGWGIAFISAICYVEERGVMGIELFSIILIYRIIDYLYHTTYMERVRKWKNYILVSIMILFIYDYSTALKAIYKIHKANNQIRTEYLKSTDGIVCSPLTQKDYNNRFIFYFNGVEAQTGIMEHYNRSIPLYVLPEPFYKAIRGDNNLFCKENQVNGSNTFYEYEDERYYIAKYAQKEGWEQIERTYRFKENGIVKKAIPYIAKKIETFYSSTNLNTTRLEINDTCYVFVNKIKRMLPELQLTKLDIKEEQ
ncbi:DUF6056 family protein [Phocaeicola coprocola]|uniref:DUF6056 family protein n=1 Tax=Phocaeicola coprocola TaxID=310298 RepID=UPI0026DCF455|nr:DUF6056 family protein [Phocaeicola coprocola]